MSLEMSGWPHYSGPAEALHQETKHWDERLEVAKRRYDNLDGELGASATRLAISIVDANEAAENYCDNPRYIRLYKRMGRRPYRSIQVRRPGSPSAGTQRHGKDKRSACSLRRQNCDTGHQDACAYRSGRWFYKPYPGVARRLSMQLSWRVSPIR